MIKAHLQDAASMINQRWKKLRRRSDPLLGIDEKAVSEYLKISWKKKI